MKRRAGVVMTFGLVLVLLGTTGATVGPGLKAKPTKDADTVDGFHAYGSPQAGALLALDDLGRYPNSVLGMGHGNGLDADTVDGSHASDFVQQGQADSVDTAMLSDGAVTTADLADGSVTSRKASLVWKNAIRGQGGGVHYTTAPPGAPEDLPDAWVAFTAEELPTDSVLLITWSGIFHNTQVGSGVISEIWVDDVYAYSVQIIQPQGGQWLQHAANVAVPVSGGEPHDVRIKWSRSWAGGTAAAGNGTLTVIAFSQ